LLKVPSKQVFARQSGKVVAEVKEDLSPLIPPRQGSYGEIIGSEVFAFNRGYSTHWGANITSAGELIRDLSRQGIGPDKDHFSFGKPRVTRAKRIRGSVATLTIEHRSNYFHFLSDAIARLQLIQNLRQPPDYIYVQGNHKYQKEVLSRLGYKTEQIIDSSQHPFIQAETLLVPSYTSNFSIISTNSISFLKAKLRKDPSKPPVSRGRIVYISRRDSPRRKMLNEDALLDRLSVFRVESVALSELSVDQQIELFETADVVIVPTGAGLANLTFARPELLLVLLTPPNWFGESALDVIKPFGLKFSHIVLSEYPSEADPYTQHVTLTEAEIQAVVEAVSNAKKSGQVSSSKDWHTAPAQLSPP